MGMTLAERILARAAGRERVTAGEFVVADIDLALLHDIFAAQVFDLLGDVGADRVFEPDRTVVVVDHLVPAPSAEAAAVHQRIREHVSRLGITAFYDAGEGICHQLLPERGHVRPGHADRRDRFPHHDLRSARCRRDRHWHFGHGSTRWPPGRLWFRVPETIRFELTGDLQPAVSWKDVILYLAGHLRRRRRPIPRHGVRRSGGGERRHVEPAHGQPTWPSRWVPNSVCSPPTRSPTPTTGPRRHRHRCPFGRIPMRATRRFTRLRSQTFPPRWRCRTRWTGSARSRRSRVSPSTRHSSVPAPTGGSRISRAAAAVLDGTAHRPGSSLAGGPGFAQRPPGGHGERGFGLARRCRRFGPGSRVRSPVSEGTAGSSGPASAASAPTTATSSGGWEAPKPRSSWHRRRLWRRPL